MEKLITWITVINLDLMIESLFSLLSVTFGIIGALGFAQLKKKYSSGLVANTIVGVFGSILMVKTVGKLGFDPRAITAQHTIHLTPLLINVMVCLISGAGALYLLAKIRAKNN